MNNWPRVFEQVLPQLNCLSSIKWNLSHDQIMKKKQKGSWWGSRNETSNFVCMERYEKFICLYNLKFRRVEVKIFCCMQCLASPEVIQLYFLLNSAELEVCFMFKQLHWELVFGIWIFYSGTNFIISWVKNEKKRKEIYI